MLLRRVDHAPSTVALVSSIYVGKVCNTLMRKRNIEQDIKTGLYLQNIYRHKKNIKLFSFSKNGTVQNTICEIKTGLILKKKLSIVLTQLEMKQFNRKKCIKVVFALT